MGVDKQVWPHSWCGFGPDFSSHQHGFWCVLLFTIPTVWWLVEDPTTPPCPEDMRTVSGFWSHLCCQWWQKTNNTKKQQSCAREATNQSELHQQQLSCDSRTSLKTISGDWLGCRYGNNGGRESRGKGWRTGTEENIPEWRQWNTSQEEGSNRQQSQTWQQQQSGSLSQLLLTVVTRFYVVFLSKRTFSTLAIPLHWKFLSHVKDCYSAHNPQSFYTFHQLLVGKFMNGLF